MAAQATDTFNIRGTVGTNAGIDGDVIRLRPLEVLYVRGYFHSSRRRCHFADNTKLLFRGQQFRRFVLLLMTALMDAAVTANLQFPWTPSGTLIRVGFSLASAGTNSAGTS